MTGYKASLKCNSGVADAEETLGSYAVIRSPEPVVKSVDYLPLDEIIQRREPGSIDYGTMTVDIYYTGTLRAKLFGLLRTVKTFKVIDPDGTTGSPTQSFSGFFTKIGAPEMAHDQRLKCTCEIAVDGDITLGTFA